MTIEHPEYFYYAELEGDFFHSFDYYTDLVINIHCTSIEIRKTSMKRYTWPWRMLRETHWEAVEDAENLLKNYADVLFRGQQKPHPAIPDADAVNTHILKMRDGVSLPSPEYMREWIGTQTLYLYAGPGQVHVEPLPHEQGDEE